MSRLKPAPVRRLLPTAQRRHKVAQPMPISKYFGGEGEKVMREMVQRYGPAHGKQVFYATAKKEGQEPGGQDLATREAGRERKIYITSGTYAQAKKDVAIGKLDLVDSGHDRDGDFIVVAASTRGVTPQARQSRNDFKMRTAKDQRARLHRALDCVLDRQYARDTENETDTERSERSELDWRPNDGADAAPHLRGLTSKSDHELEMIASARFGGFGGGRMSKKAMEEARREDAERQQRARELLTERRSKK